jgi:16S rRNA (guanine966-N2)-methyltransferase
MLGPMSRIIAGSAYGKQLRTPTGDRTRPTTERVREALFSALATWAGGAGQAPDQQLAGIRLADLYAGSGAIGLEAASRGASEVVLVESHRSAIELIRRNVATTRLGEPVRVVPATVATYLAGEPQVFDVVWLDPPYSTPAQEVDQVLARLAEAWLAPDGLVVLERSRRDPEPNWPDSLAVHWARRYGDTQLYFGRPPLADPEQE